MKKIGLLWIAVTFLAVFMLGSCSSKQEVVYESSFVLTNPDNLHDIMIKRIDLTYNDLDLTRDEIKIIEKYSKYGNVLRAATYTWPGKSETLTYKDSIYPVGVDVFEAEAIAQILGVNIEIEQVSYDEAIGLVSTGQVDFVPGVYMADNLADIGYTIDSGSVSDYLYAYSTTNIQIENINDFDGLRIGILQDLNVFNDSIVSTLNAAGVNYTLYDNLISEAGALDALRNDRLDIVIQTFSKNLIYNQCYTENVSQIFDEYGADFLFTKNNEDIDLIMSVIEKIYNYGDYMLILKQDYMDMFAAMTISLGSVFSFSERAFLYDLTSLPLNILAVNNSEPYIYYDANAENWEGISYEIWDAVAQMADIPYMIIDSGLDSNTVYKQIQEDTLQDGINAIIPMYTTQDKDGLLVFSTPIVVDKFVVVGLHGSSNIFEIYDLTNTRVGIVESLESTNIIKTYLPNKQYITGFASNDDLVDSLLARNIDYIVLSESEFEQYFYEQHNYDLTIKYEISDVQSAIAFYNNKDGRTLKSIYDKVVPFVKSGKIIEDLTSIDTDISSFIQSRNRDMLFLIGALVLLVIGFLGFFMYRLTKANKKVREIAFINNITGLHNRTAFYNDHTLATGSLILVDIDDFKRINDVHGHDIGDMYAYEIAQRIKAIADEFALKAYAMDIDSFLLLDDGSYNEDKLVSISAKILYEVTKNVRIYDTDHKLTASIGIAVKRDERGMEELYKKVDTALFLAKERGKNRYVVASEDEFFAYRKKQFLNEQLTKETIQAEIEPFYQPKVDIRDGRVIGVEALARWNSREQGMIYPKEIIPVLEENGMLPILDVSILTKACKTYVEWLDKKLVDKTFIVSCNMSYITIAQFDIVAAAIQIHDNIGMPYRSLEIEIKEADFIEHLNEIGDALIELAKLGVNISIDNFTADKTIMAQIGRLPVNVIKVDKSVLSEGITKQAREQFDTINSMTRRLNMGLIVEGIESAEEIQLMKEIPIYRVQGYYYSNTISKPDVENILRVKYIYR